MMLFLFPCNCRWEFIVLEWHGFLMACLYLKYGSWNVSVERNSDASKEHLCSASLLFILTESLNKSAFPFALFSVHKYKVKIRRTK